MGVVKERRGNEAELARVWVDCRSQVLSATTRSFPAAGSVNIEAAVDQAWAELYEQGHGGAPDELPGRWEGLAYLRALNGVRERRRHPISPIPVEAETGAFGDSGATGIDALRAEVRAQEIVRQVSGDARRWLEAVFDTPTAPPRELARTLGWDPEKLKSVARRARPRLREFVSARGSGAICERRQAVMEAFAATHLVQRDPMRAEGMEKRQALSPEFYEQVALHIVGCEECERAWRDAQSRLLRPRLVFIPIGLAGKLAAAGASVFAAGCHVLGRLDRLFIDLRLRVGSSLGRATAGGAAGTAGTAGALAGKGVTVCVGVLCATGVGTAALVGLPPSIIGPRAVSHHRHRTVAIHSGQGDYRPAARAAQSVTWSTQAGVSSPRASTAHVISKPTHPATPGDLIASSSTASGERKSKPAASVAMAASTRVSAARAHTQSTNTTQTSTARTTRAGASPCVPGSLSC